MENPFVLMVYNKDLQFQGYIGNPINLAVTPRFNETGTATVEMDLDHRLAPAILADGSRLVVYKDGVFVLSGKIHQKNAEGPVVKGTLKFFVKSDFRLVHNVLGWPVPGNAINTQTTAERTVTGNGETIAKTYIQENMVTRLGIPNVTVATSLGRGTVVPEGVIMRFHPLYEKLFPAIELSGLGLTFEQHDGAIVCDVFEPPVYPFTLTEESGVLQWWSWSLGDYTATRVVAGGDGNDEERMFVEVIDEDLEEAHNDVHEVFRSGTSGDHDDTAEEKLALLTADGQETLDESVPKSGFAVRLSETGTFRYGQDNLVVGALVTISVGGVTRTDYLREVTMTYSRDAGVEVTPVVGDIQDNPDRVIASFLARLKKSISDLKVSK
jgi:hypothetical protein